MRLWDERREELTRSDEDNVFESAKRKHREKQNNPFLSPANLYLTKNKLKKWLESLQNEETTSLFHWQ